MNDERLRLAFVGMHPTRRNLLLEKYGSARRVLSRIEQGAEKVPDHARHAALVPASDRREELAAAGIQIAYREDLPDHLASLPDAPDALFLRGRLPFDRGVAVVGTRRATTYGLRLAEQFGHALAVAGWPVVSGLAKGVDGAAHRGAIAAGGVTVAVLGCGPDRWYPAMHRRLGESILEANGAVVSEYPPGTPPSGWRFPPRNRIISGLSAVTVVVEARRDGGALITARSAIEHGREVLAVPGDVDRPASEGCNLLIRDGAIPVLGAQDLVAAVSLVLGPPAGATVRKYSDLVALIGPIGRTVDWIVEQTGRRVADVLADLARLEAAGEIHRTNGLVVPGSRVGG
ncbi:MAG: DNA-processing protein DprA [Acidimicrobiia bacterium]|nr:DNA-processing protein DprA [Acidimicrobiia bacterium]